MLSIRSGCGLQVAGDTLHHKTHIHALHLFVCNPLKARTMANTVNFTGSVDRDLLKRAKVIAAQSDTSVNALFNAELRHLVETYEAGQATGNHNFASLLDFSLGRITDLAVMDRLGLGSEEDLFLLMAQAHLPMPRLAEPATRAMAARLASLPR